MCESPHATSSWVGFGVNRGGGGDLTGSRLYFSNVAAAALALVLRLTTR